MVRYIVSIYILSLAIITSSSNLMFANTYYNMSSIEAIYINIVLFAKLNVGQIAFALQFAKLTVCIIYHTYSMHVRMYICMYVYMYA